MFPSVFEGLGISLVEAAACGLPIVATRVGGVPEVASDGEEAVLVPPNSPEALASACAEVLASADLRGRLGASARARAQRERDAAIMARQYEKLFEMEGAELEFREDALLAVARRAMQRKTGARGLRTILENVLLDTMYELPSQENVTKVVVDEAVGMWIAVAFLPKIWWVALAAFFLFRLFDIVKPAPARQFDRMRGGGGIMMDDVIACLYANIVMQIVLIFV